MEMSVVIVGGRSIGPWELNDRCQSRGKIAGGRNGAEILGDLTLGGQNLRMATDTDCRCMPQRC